MGTNCTDVFFVRTAKATFSYWKLLFLSSIFKTAVAVDFVEICKVYVGKTIIKATKRIFNSGRICRSPSDLNFGVTFQSINQSWIYIAHKCKASNALVR